MDAAEEWANIVGPWRAVAGRHGFAFVERKIGKIEGGHRCLDHLRSGATWLDLYGELGRTHGFWTATLTTWIDAGDARFSLTTVGEAVPRPRPRGGAGWLAAKLIGPLMHRLAPTDARPVPMRCPGDLGAAVTRHMAELLATGGKPVAFASLVDRFAQARRDEGS